MNNTTAITLNDRFSMIKKPSNTSVASSNRSRSRSKSRQKSSQLQGSRRNQMLLNQLEKQHKMRVAMKLKNKSRMVASRGRMQGQIVRSKLKQAAVIKTAFRQNQRLRRANSLTTFVPLNDNPSRMARGRSRSRSRSRNRQFQQQNPVPVQQRLGIRGRMRRAQNVQNNPQQQQQRGRSRSRNRIRLNRNNFRNTNNNNINGNQAALKRSNSVNGRLGRNGPAPIRRQRLRSQSRNRINAANKRIQMNRPLAGRIMKRRINRQNGNNNMRQNGNNNIRQNQLRTQNQRIIRNKRNINANNGNRMRNIMGNALRNAKKLQRGNNKIGQARGRAMNRRGAPNQQQQQQQRRGRSRTRRPNNNMNNRGGNNKQISKDVLDKQLDEYMAKGSA